MMNAEVFIPGSSDDPLSEGLRLLTFCLADKGLVHGEGYGLGGPYGYGADFENDTFMMHGYCWCEEDDCAWCFGGAPHFLFKPSGFSIRWYKWIGRDNELSGPCSIKEAFGMIAECLRSIGCDDIEAVRIGYAEAQQRSSDAMQQFFAEADLDLDGYGEAE